MHSFMTSYAFIFLLEFFAFGGYLRCLRYLPYLTLVLRKLEI